MFSSCSRPRLCLANGCSMARSLAPLFPCPRFLFACPLVARLLRRVLSPCVCVCAWVWILCVCLGVVHKLVLVFVRVLERLHSIFRVCVHLRVHAFCLVCSSCTRLCLCLASERLLLARSLTFFIVRYSSLRVRACSPLASLSRLLRVCLCVCAHIMCVCVGVCICWCLCVYVGVSARWGLRLCVCVSPCMQLFVSVCICACIRFFVHVELSAHSCLFIYVCVRVFVCTCA